MFLRRKSFAASAVTASLVTTLLTAPFSTAQVAADGTRTVNAPMSCQSFGKNGVSVDRTHTAPSSATTRYPSEVAPGEQFTFEYQPDQGSIGRTPSHSKGMWVGRMKYDITLPTSNATIGAPSLDLNSREKLSGWPSSWNTTYHSNAANEVLAERLTSQGDVPAANGDILRIWGKDTRTNDRYTPHNSGGDDANIGIGVGNGRNDQTQAVGSYRLPKVTVPVTAGNSAGQDIIFGFRGAGTPDLAINNQTYRQPNNTLGFQEYYNQVVTLCRPTDNVPLATIKVVEPYSPDFTIEVTGNEAAGSERTVTATIPNKEVTGQVKFVAKPKAGGEAIDLGTGEIKDGQATATKKIDNPGDYEVTATLTSPRKVYEDSTATADLKISAAASNVALVADQSLTAGVPGDLKVTVAKGAQGTITISDGTNSWTTDQIDAEGSATVPNVTFDSTGSKPVTVSFTPSNSAFEASESDGSVTVNDKQDSTLTLGASKTNPKAGEAVELTATVKPDEAKGEVQFKDGDNVLATAPLNNNNQATYTYTPSAEGPKTITAVFVPSENSTFKGDTKTVELNVQTAAQDTGITLDVPATAKATEEVALTANVEPANVQGTVEFFNGTTSLGTGEYDQASGTATLKKKLPAGTYNVTAKFTPTDDAAYNGKTSEAKQLVVSNVATTVEYTGDTTGQPNEPITLRATVKDADGNNVNGGTVEFGVGQLQPVTAEVKNGVAETEHTFTSIATRNVTTKFVPAANSGYTGDTAPTTPIVIKGTASTTLTATKTDPIVGEEVTLTAKVNPAQAGGQVQLKDGDTVVETKRLESTNNEATFTFTPKNTNSKTLTAVYVPSENSNYTAGPAGSVTINPKAAEQTSLTIATNPAIGTTNDEITLTATVPAGAKGKVQFFNNGEKLGDEQTVDNGTATWTTRLPEGDNKITATFTSDNVNAFTNAEDSNVVTVDITKAPEAIAPTVTVQAPTGETTTDDEVTLTAKVDPASAGTVAFYNGDTKLPGTVTYNAATGEASLTTTLPAGDYTITATFTPAADNTTAKEATSKEATFTVTEKKDDNQQPPAPEATAPTVTVQAPTGETTTDDEVTLTAKVNPASAGSVEFFNGDTKIDGDVTYDASTGEATLTTTLPAGDYSVTAKFTPAADNTTAKEATSTAATFTVTKKKEDNQQPPAPEATAPTVTVTAPTGETTTDDEVTLTAKVDPASAGSVEFFNGDTKLPGTVNYDASTGEATLTTTLPAGDYTVTAKFTPADNNETALEATSKEATFTVTEKEDNQQPPAPEATAPTVTVTAPTGETTTDDKVTLTAKIDPASAGSVEFFNGDTKIDGDVTYDASTGEATLTTKLPAGDYTITATFTPATDNTTAKASTSDAAAKFTVTEKKDNNQQPPAPEATAPTVTVQAPTGETTTDDEVTLTAKINPASAGSVEFFNGDTKLPGTVTYNEATGEASLTTKLPAGDYTITATFTPAADNTTAKEATSTEATFTVTEKKDDNQQPPAPNTPQSVEIAANGQETVTVEDGNTTVKFSVEAAPGQTITFKLSDGTKLGEVKADANGVATLVHDFKAAGTYTVTATAQDAPTPNDGGSSLSVEGKGVLAGTIIGAVLSLIVAIGSQTHIPGINNAITNVQRQLGIHNPQLAGQVERALPTFGALTGIAGLATAIGLLVKAIKDGDVKFEIIKNGNGDAGSSVKPPKNDK